MLPDPLCTARGFSCSITGISNRGVKGELYSLPRGGPLALGEPPEAFAGSKESHGFGIFEIAVFIPFHEGFQVVGIIHVPPPGEDLYLKTFPPEDFHGFPEHGTGAPPDTVKYVPAIGITPETQ